MEDPASRKIMLKGYLDRQKETPSGPDQASICDELGVRTCWQENLTSLISRVSVATVLGAVVFSVIVNAPASHVSQVKSSDMAEYSDPYSEFVLCI